jgi:hypothetical protein
MVGLPSTAALRPSRDSSQVDTELHRVTNRTAGNIGNDVGQGRNHFACRQRGVTRVDDLIPDYFDEARIDCFHIFPFSFAIYAFSLYRSKSQFQ